MTKRRIDNKIIKELLAQNLTIKDDSFVRSISRAQREYPSLTIRKWVKFWIIHDRYLVQTKENDE